MERQRPSRSKAFWPVMGLLLALCSAVFAYLLSDPVLTYLKRALPNFPARTTTVTLLTQVILFALIAMIFSLLVAIAVPRKKSAVTEIQMAKDRTKMVNEKMARKIRQRDINRQNKAR